MIQKLIALLVALFTKKEPIHPAPQFILEGPPIIVPPEAPQAPVEEVKPEVLLWDTKEHIRHSMRVIGDEYNMTVLQKDLLCDICQCESGFVLTAKLVNSPTSIDRGLFQWNNRWHPEITDEIAYDPEKATRLACKAILNKQSHAFWSASERCWNKTGKYTSII